MKNSNYLFRCINKTDDDMTTTIQFSRILLSLWRKGKPAAVCELLLIMCDPTEYDYDRDI